MRINRKDDLGPSRGIVKYIHKTVMFITLPFRKPLIVIPVLILAYLIPTFIGAKPAEVHLWYYSKIKEIFSTVKVKVEETGKGIIPDSVKDFSKQTIESFKSHPEIDNTSKIVETPVTNPQSIRRQMFEKAKEAPSGIDILNQKDNIIQAEPQGDITSQVTGKGEPVAVTKKQHQDNTKETAKKLDLIYLVTPQEFSGAAKVTNANEIVVDGNSIFLYGIYVDPNTTSGIQGKDYLSRLIGQSLVKCIVEAYTKQGFATGLCFVNGININHDMVNQGYSRNVALER